MIEYIFQIDDNKILYFQINTNRKHNDNPNCNNYPFWAELQYHQCKNCTLLFEKHHYCPAAADLQKIIEDFSPLLSYEKAHITVKTPERDYCKICDIQTGLQSVIGVIMATSSCPILSKLNMLAHFHLPFATTEDTLFRTVGAYLIQQYFILSDGNEPDFKLEKLKKLYSDLEQLNTSFSERIRIASKKDANLGAVVQLGALSFMVRTSLEFQLKDFKEKFFKSLFAKKVII